MKIILLILLCFTVAACSTSSKMKTKSSKKFVAQKTVQATRGFLVEGQDQDLAINNMFDQIIDLTEEELVIIKDGKNPNYYGRLLNAVFDPKSTVAQVNQALKKANVLLTFSEERSSEVTILVPPPGGLENLKKYQKLLVESKVFQSVTFEYSEQDVKQKSKF